jgi:phage repressor protein C with HTH and peptisase S24 domain
MAEKNIEFGKRLDRYIFEAGFNNKRLAEMVGISPSAIGAYINEGRIPEAPILQKIARSLNKTMEELLTGEVTPYKMKDSTGGIAEGTAIYNDKEFVFIPQVTGEISAGGGLIADDTIEMRIAFRREWIEKKGDHHNMSLIRVSGDSMEPTLLSGDLVLIDHNRNFVDPQGGIYAISMDSIIMIKRLQVIYHQNRMKVISDNARYEAMDIDPGQVKVNGKVIWYGRELER